MANERALRTNFVGGLVENNPLLASDTALSSAALAAAPIVDSTSHCTIILDPDGVAGPPEIAWITVHTSGATTATIQRAVESTSARDHIRDTPWIHAPTAADYGNAVGLDRVYVKATAGNPLDDEFNDSTLDAAWTRVDPTGLSSHLTWTEGADNIAAYHTGTDAAAVWHALLKPIGANFAVGNSIDTAMSYMGQRVSSPMAALFLTDGTTYGSGAQIAAAYWSSSADYHTAGLRRQTGYNSDNIPGGNINLGPSSGRYRMHNRLKWVSANTFSQWVSNDGISWYPVVLNAAMTCTPTHAGFGVCTWASTPDMIWSFDYFRVS